MGKVIAEKTTIYANLKWSAGISAVLVLLFMLLEWVNRRAFHDDFPIGLFGVLWLLPAAFIFILLPVVRSVRAGTGILGNPCNLLLRIVCLILITWLWVALIHDQMPCFLGVPNCD